MSALAPFCAKPVCPKCGERRAPKGEVGVHREYHEAGECVFPHSCPRHELARTGPTIGTEHLYHYCRGCGYEWRTQINSRAGSGKGG